ncbi:uncharacterized protein LOC109602518 isoform X5 [Aethina tumida]|uniref:uncharacterized protein LOC109602518 isoform X5 n=1 Tax=Aethina tumida TaxID=116153 RepID=UPI00096AE5F0|nr:uncharacterized protein LOC109602518 isoform X5 [Aethina tumida]
MGVPSPSHGSGYATNIYGIFKIVELAFILLSMLLLSYFGWSGDLGEASIIGCLLLLLISLTLFILGIAERGLFILRTSFIPLVCCFIYALVVSSIQLSKSHLPDETIGGAVCYLLASFVYLADAVLSFIAYRST